MSSVRAIESEVTINSGISAECIIGRKVIVHDIVPEADVYEGEYTFTPTEQEQIIHTTNKTLIQDVIINPVPSDYGGSSVQIAIGSVTGEGTTTLVVSCDFEPDLIYVYGDMSDSTSNRGVVSITILKDVFAYMSSDSSTSNTNEDFTFGDHNISGYGDPTNLYVAYSNGTLTIDTLSNTSSRRFRSGQTYYYKFIKWT